MKKHFLWLALGLMTFVSVQAQYIHQVYEYTPAPGQYINSSPWGVPESANSIIGGVTGSMSLGAFGGYVIFSFQQPVQNHPDNPYGIDFTIFGNALSTMSEQGVVWVMKDENGNGLPDDTWYELAGSDYFFSSTLKDYEVTYINPNMDVATDVPWVDNLGNSGFIYANSFHTQPYYPLVELFPQVDSEQYTLVGTRVEDGVYQTTPTNVGSKRKAFGYADNTPRGQAPYTVPDNPYTTEIENAGADGFDISWAVDENGQYVDLDEIHFVKVQTAVLANAGWLGEISTEITGACVVEPNPAISGELDMVVIKSLPDTIRGEQFQLEAWAFHQGRRTPEKTISWSTSLDKAYVDIDKMLFFSTSGEVTITAFLQQRPEISTTATTYLLYEGSSSVNNDGLIELKLYPNPATDNLYVSGAKMATLQVFSVTGVKVLEVRNYSGEQPISVGHLPKGAYLLRINMEKHSQTLRFIKGE